MLPALPPPMLKELRQLLASAIADAKAYDVPGVCRRLNLADGTEQEAYSSKFKYAHRRIVDLSAEEVLASARQYLKEEENFLLSEQLAKIDELSGQSVSTITRRRLIALFEETPLARDMDDVDFIRNVWPIDSMAPPANQSEPTLEKYLLFEAFINEGLKPKNLEALGLIKCSRALLFKFIEFVTAPEARTGQDQLDLAEKISDLLRQDGYLLDVAGHISGSPFYRVRPIPMGSPADENISAILAAFDQTQVHARWTAAMDRRTSDPSGAITLARTLIEDVCKWILDQAGDTWSETDDLPALYRKLAKTLKLAPDDHTEQVFKQILGSCQSVVESLGALRNKLGDAHSPGPKRARPHSRHAELAVNLAGAMATFLVATWEARQSEAIERQ